jgi:hypothetical protein
MFTAVTTTFIVSQKHGLLIAYSSIIFSVLRADRDYTNSSATRGGGALIAVSELHGVKRRFDLEIIKECVWIEILTKIIIIHV